MLGYGGDGVILEWRREGIKREWGSRRKHGSSEERAILVAWGTSRWGGCLTWQCMSVWDRMLRPRCFFLKQKGSTECGSVGSIRT